MSKGRKNNPQRGFRLKQQEHDLYMKRIELNMDISPQKEVNIYKNGIKEMILVSYIRRGLLRS